MRYIRVKNLDKYQHYKERRPPWVKLHQDALENYEFEALPDAAKFHCFAIILLASRTDNRIPADSAWIGRKIGAQSKVNLETLENAGFIEYLGDASEPLADSKQVAQPEGEGETETEAEIPPSGDRELTPQQIAVKQIQDAFEERGLEPPEGKVAAGWRGQWGRDDYNLLRCLGQILDAGVPPHKPAHYVGKCLTSALKNGKKVWKAGGDGLTEYERELKRQADAYERMRHE